MSSLTLLDNSMREAQVLIGGRQTPDGQKGHPGPEERVCSLDFFFRRVILCANLWSAELSKLTARHAGPAHSSINSISALCEADGCGCEQVHSFPPHYAVPFLMLDGLVA